MAATARELWRGTNGDAWPVGAWHNPVLYPGMATASTIDIQSNVGRLLPSTANATPGGGIFLRRSPALNGDLTVTLDHALNTTGFAVISLRATLDMDANARPTNSVNIVLDGGNDNVTVDKEIAGANTSLSGAVAFTQTPGTPTVVRFRVVGPSIKVKWWISTSNEPTAWNYETNDPTTQFPGYVGLAYLSDINGNSAKFTNFAFDDLTPAPPLRVRLLRPKPRFPSRLKPIARTAPIIRAVEAVDTLLGTDTASAVVTPGAITATDNLLGTDTAARTSTLPRTIADTLLGGDTATRTATFTRPAADTLLGGDTATRAAQAFARPIADALLGTDTATRTSSRARGITDALLGGDTTTRTSTGARGITDVLLGGDTATRAPGAFTRTTVDTLLGADVATRALVLPRATTDTLLGGDVATRTTARTRAITDTLLGGDTATRTSTRTRSVTDTLLGGDAATRGTQTFSRAITDTLLGGDVATGFGGKLRPVTDVLLGADVATRAAQVFTRTTVDALLGGDTASRATNAPRTTTDALLGGDTATGAAARARTATDNLLGPDVATRAVLAFLRSAADTLLGADAATRTALAVVRAITDRLLGGDTATGTTTIIGTERRACLHVDTVNTTGVNIGLAGDTATTLALEAPTDVALTLAGVAVGLTVSPTASVSLELEDC
jgi:hypothetical protein